MRFENIKDTPSGWNVVERIYTDSFPEEERRPLQDLRNKAMNDESPLRMLLIMDDERIAGFISFWEFGEFVYIEHFAIDGPYRGAGIGSRAIDRFREMVCRPIVLEVEIPEHPGDIAGRRVAFYERHGFSALREYEYSQPPYQIGLPEVPMWLMTTGEPPLDADFLTATLHRNVYGKA